MSPASALHRANRPPPRTRPAQCTAQTACGNPRSLRRPAQPLAASVASKMPATAPRHPACAAPITPAVASANSTGAQSAVTIPSAMPGRSVTAASARGPAPGNHAASTGTAMAPCTCVSPTSDAGSAPTVRATLTHGFPTPHPENRRGRTSCNSNWRTVASRDPAAPGEEAVAKRQISGLHGFSGHASNPGGVGSAEVAKVPAP